MNRKHTKPQPVEVPECKDRKREQRRAREQMARRIREARG
jgi:hypothetical protein